MYQMAAYCRLSKDDGENKISESIENQMKLIREELKEDNVNEADQFEEELKKFHPSLEIDEAEDVIINHNMTDFTDILVDMVKEQEKEMTDAAGKKE